MLSDGGTLSSEKVALRAEWGTDQEYISNVSNKDNVYRYPFL